MKMQSKPNLFYYWEGEQPGFISLCLKTIKKHCSDSFNLCLLDKDNVDQYTSLPEEYYLIERPAHRTDYLKAKLVFEKGGFWIDADTIVLSDFSDWIKYFNKHDFIGTPGFFGGPKGSWTIGNWFLEMDKLIHKKQDFSFSELIYPLIKRKEYDPFSVLSKEQFLPVWYEAPDINIFWNPTDGMERITDESKVVILFNNCFPEWFKEMSEEAILKSPMFISKLFRKSLENI